MDFTVRAAGADRSFQRFMLAKFPMNVPDLREDAGGQWRMHRETLDGGAKEWSLEDASGAQKFRGVPDAGLTGNGAPSNYFMLMKQRGSKDWVAIPVSEWATFKAEARRSNPSLEEAEAQMKYQRLRAARANPRLAQAVGADEGEGAAAAAAAAGAAAGRDEEEADSDEEWKDIRARAAGQAAFGAAPPARPRSAEGGAADEDEEDFRAFPVVGAATAEEYVARPRDAEDWEHSEEAADDDLDMVGSDGEEVEASPAQRPALSESEGEDDLDPSKAKRALKQMMRQTGLEESEGSEGADEEESEEEDLDKMAEEVLPGPSPPAAAAAARKRKSPPLPEVAPPAAAAAPDQLAGAKRARVQGPAAAAGAVAGLPGMPTEAEVVGLLQERQRMTLADISAIFKARLPTTEAKKAFAQLIKAVAKLDPASSADGKKYMILK